MINIYTDGACKKNPGPGGYGVVASRNGEIIYTQANYCDETTTNNKEELKGLLEALWLTQTKFKNEICTIYSDSAYCVNMFNSWVKNWARNNWINSQKKTVENLELVQKIYKFTELDFPNFKVCKVSGHAGVLENELADALASKNDKKLATLIEENNITLLME